MKSALITATLVATSHAAAVTCDWKANSAGTDWEAGLSCADGYDCCTPGFGWANTEKIEQACIGGALGTSMTAPDPKKWGTNLPVGAICCKRDSFVKDDKWMCNELSFVDYQKKGSAKPDSCPEKSTKCGDSACMIIPDNKVCKDDKLMDNTCDAWYALAKDSQGGPLLATACGAVTWTDKADMVGKTCDDSDGCKYAAYKTGAFTDAKKSTNKDAKLICYKLEGKKEWNIKPWGKVVGYPEGGSATYCSPSFNDCKAPDTTKQGCPGYDYPEDERKKFYPDGACTCNTYAATPQASSATSAALSAFGIISAGLLALL